MLFWDVYGKQGHPIRATISEMGPVLLSRLLGLNDTQQAVLELAFHIADDQGLLLLDVKDIRAMLQWVGGEFDSEAFDLTEINAHLELYDRHTRQRRMRPK